MVSGPLADLWWTRCTTFSRQAANLWATKEQQPGGIELLSDGYSNRMAVFSGIVIDSIKSAFRQLGGNLVLRKKVNKIRAKPISNFYWLPTKHQPDHVSHEST